MANPKNKKPSGPTSSISEKAQTFVIIESIVIGFISLIIYILSNNDISENTLSLVTLICVNAIWFVVSLKLPLHYFEMSDQIRKKWFLILLIFTLSYLTIICLLLFTLGIGIYAYRFTLIFHAVNAGFLFTCVLFRIEDLHGTTGLTTPPKRFYWLPLFAFGIFTIGGLLGLFTFRYLTIVPQTTSGWNNYATSINPYERKVSIKYFLNSSDLSSLSHILLDPNSSVAEIAYNAIWKLHKEESIPILIEYLRTTTNESKARSLAEEYVNSGNSALEAAGTSWAHDHGYEIISQPSSSDSRKWSN